MSFPPPSPKQARVLWSSLTALAVGVLVALLILLLWGLGKVLQQLSSVLLPLGVAGVLAYLLDPVVDRLEARGLPRARAIICVFALAVVIVGGVIGSVVPQIVTETQQLAERIPAYINRVQDRVVRWINQPPATLSKW